MPTIEPSVSYVWSSDLIKYADRLPSNRGRASRVHSLIEAFGLVDKCKIIECQPCDICQLYKFHDRRFIDYLTASNHDHSTCSSEDEVEYPYHSDSDCEDKDALYGLQYDCPYFEGLSEYVRLVAGATIQASDSLVNEQSKIAIHWNGGRHHAKKAKSAGFCYVNDIVLAILRLRERFSTVMYIDFDLHHGDGVEAAFLHSKNVITLSIHRYGRGFYPSTGGDFKNARRYPTAINVPLRRGTSDELLKRVCREIVVPAIVKYNPNAFVVNLGSDGLARDEHGEWNLTIDSFKFALNLVLEREKPTLLVGGGGYNSQDTARCWSYLTAQALGVADNMNWEDIPEHEFYNEYKQDGYRFAISSLQRKDENDDEYVTELIKRVTKEYQLNA